MKTMDKRIKVLRTQCDTWDFLATEALKEARYWESRISGAAYNDKPMYIEKVKNCISRHRQAATAAQEIRTLLHLLENETSDT